MRVHLTTTTFDLQGAVTLDLLPESDMGERSRRMNRVATLDGGAALNDFGYTDADRTMALNWRPARGVDDAVGRLVRLYARLRLASHEGVFLVAPERMRLEPGRSTLVLLVLEKLA